MNGKLEFFDLIRLQDWYFSDYDIFLYNDFFLQDQSLVEFNFRIVVFQLFNFFLAESWGEVWVARLDGFQTA